LLHPPGLMPSVNTDQAVAELAAHQHGVFTHQQARGLGADHRFINRRVALGQWRAVTTHVLAAAGTPDGPKLTLMAAVLHVGTDAVASHRAAAALWRIPGFDLGEIHVTLPHGRFWEPPPKGELHAMPLPAAHVTAVDGIPCTTVPRTLFDLAAYEQFERRVERAVDNALSMRLVSVATLDDLVRHSKGRPGVVLMRKLLEGRQGAYVPPASELEVRFFELVRAAGLPEPVRQLPVGGDEHAGRVDAAWPDHRLVVELDSRRHHSARLDSAEDVRRDVAAAGGGWATMRITWEDVFTYPERTMDRLADALAEIQGERAMRRAG